jgi:hypothetical protein
MNPFEPAKPTADQSRTIEDLVKIGLVEYIHNRVLKGSMPTDEDLLYEAQNIITNADQFASGPGNPETSWFRDLILLANTTEEQTRLTGPDAFLPWAQRLEMIAAQTPHNRTDLETIPCSKQRSLMAFVKAKQALGLTPTDRELQAECCRILDEIETTSNYKCQAAVGWFKYLIGASTCWLREFRRWAGLPRSSEMASEHIRSTDDKSIDYSIHNHARLENELKDWTAFQLSVGIVPTDADLQQQARLIVYKNDDPWNQTDIDDPAILLLFKRQNGLAPPDDDNSGLLHMHPLLEACYNGCSEDHEHMIQPPQTLHWNLESLGINLSSPNSGRNSVTGTFTPNNDQPLHMTTQNQPSTNSNPTLPLKYFLNDANCYGRLVRELNRFVTTCTSPNNPNQHVSLHATSHFPLVTNLNQIPTDAEIQNQARWIVYDDDDPWNQTAADNAEWLIRFKRDAGLAPREDGPGLPSTVTSWQVKGGGSGFSPPHLWPKAPLAPFTDDVPVKMDQKVFKVKATTAAKFLKSMPQRWQKPASVFCSRDLENGLNEFVRAEMAKGDVPSDEALRTRAREILGVDRTPADEVELLEKFKAMHGISQSATQPGATDSIPTFDDAMLAEFDQELGIGDMDLSGLEIPAEISSLKSFSSPHPATQTKSPLETEEVLHDFAELHRVNAATASPLRRRASEKMAAQAGFSMPRAGQANVSPTSQSFFS